MSDTPSTIRFGSLEADAHEPAPVAEDPLAELAMLREIVGHLLEYQQGSLEREQRALRRHAEDRSELHGRLLLVEQMVAELLVTEHSR
jgi:hypothetical protein